MKIFDKHILRELLGPFIFGVMAFTSVFFAGTYLLKLTTWVMNGMPLLAAGELLLLFMPQIIVYTLPMSTLLAVLMGLGKLSSDSEITAMYAGGISLYRLMLPVVFFGVLVSGLSIALNESIAPWANARSNDMQAAVLKQITQDDAEKNYTRLDKNSNIQLTVRSGIDTQSGTLKDLTLIVYKEKKPAMIIFAKKAVWQGLNDPNKKYKWLLFDGWWQSLDLNTAASGSFRNTETKEVKIYKTPEEIAIFQYNKDTEQLSFKQLSKMVAIFKRNPDAVDPTYAREVEVNKWNKLSLPLSSLIFAILAAPLAVKPQRSSSSVGLGLSILVIFIYYMVWHYTASLSTQGTLPPIVGSFLADVIGIGASIMLLKKAYK